MIAELERLLADARAGRLRGFAFGVIYDNGDKEAGWSAGERDPGIGAAIKAFAERHSPHDNPAATRYGGQLPLL